MRSVAPIWVAAALAVPAGALVACGDDSSEQPATRSQRPTQPSSEDRETLAAIRAATRATAADFPPTGGRTLQQIADTTKAGSKAGLATGVLLPRTERLAFGVLAADNRFLYGQTAVYVARRGAPTLPPAIRSPSPPASRARAQPRTPPTSRSSTRPGCRSPSPDATRCSR